MAQVSSGSFVDLKLTGRPQLRWKLVTLAAMNYNEEVHAAINIVIVAVMLNYC